MTNPNKKHSNRLISIAPSADNGLDNPNDAITGTYRHIDRSIAFELVKQDGSVSRLMRKEWQIVHVWKYGANDYVWSQPTITEVIPIVEQLPIAKPASWKSVLTNMVRFW